MTKRALDDVARAGDLSRKTLDRLIERYRGTSIVEVLLDQPLELGCRQPPVTSVRQIPEIAALFGIPCRQVPGLLAPQG